MYITGGEHLRAKFKVNKETTLRVLVLFTDNVAGGIWHEDKMQQVVAVDLECKEYPCIAVVEATTKYEPKEFYYTPIDILMGALLTGGGGIGGVTRGVFTVNVCVKYFKLVDSKEKYIEQKDRKPNKINRQNTILQNRKKI